MGRSYAGILALLAFFVTIARATVHGGEPSSTLFQAWLALILFAGVGYVAGRLAEWIVDDALRSKVMAEISAREAAQGNEATGGGLTPASATASTDGAVTGTPAMAS